LCRKKNGHFFFLFTFYSLNFSRTFLAMVNKPSTSRKKKFLSGLFVFSLESKHIIFQKIKIRCDTGKKTGEWWKTCKVFLGCKGRWPTSPRCCRSLSKSKLKPCSLVMMAFYFLVVKRCSRWFFFPLNFVGKLFHSAFGENHKEILLRNCFPPVRTVRSMIFLLDLTGLLSSH